MCKYLLVLLLVLLPPLVFGLPPAEMTEAEIIAELMDNLEKRESLIESQELELTERETRLTERKSLLEQRENTLNARQKLWTETEAYWKNYSDGMRRESRFNLIRGFAWGVFIGSMATIILF